MGQDSELIVIRHGASGYTDQYPDLVDDGQAQVLQTAGELKAHIATFDCVVTLSSRAVRAMGSAEIFLDGVGRTGTRIRRVGALASVGFFDPEGFTQYMADRPQLSYTDLWMHDELFADENHLTESRKSVEQRARNFIIKYGVAIQRISETRHIAICAIAFTHFEVGNELLKGALTPGDFPQGRQPVLRNAEPVIIELGEAERHIFTVHGRGRSRRARFDPITGRFKRTRAAQRPVAHSSSVGPESV